MKTLLLLITLLPTVAVAQEDPWEAEAAGKEAAAESDARATRVYPGIEEPVKLQRKVREGHHEPRSLQLKGSAGIPTRLFVELGGALGGAAVAVVVGVPVGCALDVITTSSSYKSCGVAAVFVPALISLVAIPTGVYLAGDAVGSGGGVGGAILGFIGGGLAVIPAVMLINASGATLIGGSPFGSLISVGTALGAALLPFIGAVIGHELSGLIFSPDDAGAQLSLTPTADISAERSLAGISVTF